DRASPGVPGVSAAGARGGPARGARAQDARGARQRPRSRVMPDIKVDMRWTGTGLEFEGGASDGVRLLLDGNSQSGVSPMQAMLLSLVGCTAADIVDILAKMRVPLEGLEVVAEGDRAPEPPRRYTRIRLEYRVQVPDDAREKVRRAVTLSHEQYCSVLHTLRPDVVFETYVVLVQSSGRVERILCWWRDWNGNAARDPNLRRQPCGSALWYSGPTVLRRSRPPRQAGRVAVQ